MLMEYTGFFLSFLLNLYICHSSHFFCHLVSTSLKLYLFSFIIIIHPVGVYIIWFFDWFVENSVIFGFYLTPGFNSPTLRGLTILLFSLFI